MAEKNAVFLVQAVAGLDTDELILASLRNAGFSVRGAYVSEDSEHTNVGVVGNFEWAKQDPQHRAVVFIGVDQATPWMQQYIVEGVRLHRLTAVATIGPNAQPPPALAGWSRFASAEFQVPSQNHLHL